MWATPPREPAPRATRAGARAGADLWAVPLTFRGQPPSTRPTHAGQCRWSGLTHPRPAAVHSPGALLPDEARPSATTPDPPGGGLILLVLFPPRPCARGAAHPVRLISRTAPAAGCVRSSSSVAARSVTQPSRPSPAHLAPRVGIDAVERCPDEEELRTRLGSGGAGTAARTSPRAVRHHDTAGGDGGQQPVKTVPGCHRARRLVARVGRGTAQIDGRASVAAGLRGQRLPVREGPADTVQEQHRPANAPAVPEQRLCPAGGGGVTPTSRRKHGGAHAPSRSVRAGQPATARMNRSGTLAGIAARPATRARADASAREAWPPGGRSDD